MTVDDKLTAIMEFVDMGELTALTITKRDIERAQEYMAVIKMAFDESVYFLGKAIDALEHRIDNESLATLINDGRELIARIKGG